MTLIQVFDRRSWTKVGDAAVIVTNGSDDGVPTIGFVLTGALADTVWQLHETASIAWSGQVWTVQSVERDPYGSIAVRAINWEQEMQRHIDAQYEMFRRYVWTVQSAGTLSPRWRVRRTQPWEAPTNTVGTYRTFEEARRAVAANVDRANRWRKNRCTV